MDNMKVFTCRDRYDDMATCIYEAWSMALQVGHDHVMLMKEPVEQLDMFADYIHVFIPISNKVICLYCSLPCDACQFSPRLRSVISLTM